MTKERFKNVGKDIFQYGEWWCGANGAHCADVIATALNQLIEENEQLKKTNKRLHDKLQNVTSFESLKIGETTKLEKENKRLRAILRIYRKIANCRNCDYHDYDCRSDGDDFEVCEKGYDMSYSICKDWREL